MVWQIVYTGFHTVVLGNVPTVCVSVVKNSVQLTTLRFGVKVTLIIHSSQTLREHNVSYQRLCFLAMVVFTYSKLFDVVQMIKPGREKCQEGETNTGTYDEKVYHRR
jgi:hypothetical protein